jgi:hypothetical protein
MPSPALVFSIVLAGLYAALFQYIWGRRLNRKWLYWLVALAGFGLGQLLASFAPRHPLRIGNVHLLGGTLGCWIALFVGKWFNL